MQMTGQTAACPGCSSTTAVQFVTLLLLSAIASGQDCGTQGNACCCKANDWQNPSCCATGLQCTMFAGQGFGWPPVVQNLCLPKNPSGCGSQDGPCCIATGSGGYPKATCSNGLVCSPPSSGWGSMDQYKKLKGGFAAAAKDTAVLGKCVKMTTADCGQAFMPCGKDIGAAGVSCPGNPTTCPSGYYCAAKFDAGVGERCIPIPSNAGQMGGPCLPNNLANAPNVKFTGKEMAPAFCTGSAVCFTGVSGDTTGFTHDKPAQAKSLASRIRGTRCLSVPSDCGAAPGKPCCPSTAGVVTDKPLASSNFKVAGQPCNDAASEFGMWCEGSYVALGGLQMGVCRANPECGGPDQPCCNYSKAAMAGVNCPRLGGPGKGYCSIASTCKVCPQTVEIVEDIFRCY